MSANYMVMAADDISEGQSPSPSPEASPISTPRPPSRTRAAAARRNSVTVACERCRRRKIRCSGLPGPCTSCAKFKVSCLDPGKRKQRSSSFLEDRIKRLEELAATGVPLDPAVVNSLKSNTDDPMDTGNDRNQNPGPLHIDTSISANHSTFDDSAFYSMDSYASELWSYPATPAAYSDMGPDVEEWWSQKIPADMPMNTEPSFNLFNATHRRAQTFPAIPIINHPSAPRDPHALLSPCSDIPSIQITSHDGSNSPSPSLHPVDSSPWTLPFRDSLSLPAGHIAEPSPQAVHNSPLLLSQDFNPLAGNITSGEYYGDFLSPLDRPPTLSRRPSISTSASRPGMNNVSEWTTRVSSPSSNLNEHRSKRRHTTCSIPRTTLSVASKLAMSPEASWMLSSPRTTNYLRKYFSTIHPQYPFLTSSDFFSHPSENFDTSPFFQPHDQSNPTKTYTRLMTAAIGALLHHNSRDISARYVRYAMAISTDTDLEATTMWSSISGIHSAMLLAVYCLLEQTMTFHAEEENTSHPEVNLWLWNCRIAASCIDLGLHECQTSSTSRSDKMKPEGYEIYDHASGGMYGGGVKIPMQQQEDGERDSDLEEGDEDDEDSQLSDLYRNTFCSAFLLDRQISEVRKRPRAIHEADVDEALLKNLL